MKKLLMSMAFEDVLAIDSDNEISTQVIVDPDKLVDNNLLAVQDIDKEAKDLATSVSDGQVAANALTDIASAIEPATLTDGLSPQEIACIKPAIEHFKRMVDYRGSAAILSLESFGGSLSKKQGTVLAIEELATLVAEINTQVEKTDILDYQYDISKLDNLNKARISLNADVQESSINLSNFYKSDKFKPENLNNNINDGLFIGNIFSSAESVEGKMPTAAVISGLQALKSSYSTTATMSKVEEVKQIVDQLANSSDFGVKIIEQTFSDLDSKFSNSFIAKEFIRDECITKQLMYPLGGIKLTTINKTTESSLKNRYTTYRVDVSREVIDEKIGSKLGLLSAEESATVSSTINELTNSSVYIDAITGLIESVIALKRKSAEYSKQASIVGVQPANQFNDKTYLVRDVCSGLIDYFICICNTELKVLHALNSYCKASVSQLASMSVVA